MPYKDPVKQKEAQKRWYLRKLGDSSDFAAKRKKQSALLRKEQRGPSSRIAARVDMLARKLATEKAVATARNVGCKLCSERDHCCLDFHHIDPSSKSFSISRRTLKTYAENIDSEISKCVVLCKNCHAKVHAGVLTL